MSRPTAPTPPAPERAHWLAWLGVAVLVVVGAASALVEVLLVPLYVGGVIFPIAALLALGLNILLPRLVRGLVASTPMSSLPLLAWLLVVIFFGLQGRPEGDVVLPGGGGAVEWVVYVVVFGGAVAGAFGIVSAVPPPADSRAALRRQERATRAR